MNHLNSVLLEGVVEEKPEMHDGVTLFYISSVRELKISSFQVQAKERLGEICLDKLQAGSKVRVVGSLESKRSRTPELWDTSRFWINAEHVEIKPYEGV